MSDFDKEAEREKLRKKFARDDEKRTDTRRMSELLLKGATMTNKHCDQCSDPLFRYNGQTFCPSCQAQGAAVQAETDATETRTEQAPETQQSTTPQESTAGDDRVAETDQSRQPQGEQSTQPQADRSPGMVSPVGGRQEKTESNTGVDDRTPASTSDLTEARQSLTRTLTRFAQQAERTDDPRRARELLGAAREAAATLAALD